MPSPTISSPDASRPREPARAGLVLADYGPGESDEAMELERASTQGSAYRLAFRRAAFHLRAAGFAVHRIRTARLGGRLVGDAEQCEAVAWPHAVNAEVGRHADHGGIELAAAHRAGRQECRQRMRAHNGRGSAFDK